MEGEKDFFNFNGSYPQLDGIHLDYFYSDIGQNQGSDLIPDEGSSVFDREDAPLLWTLTVLYILNIVAVIVCNAVTLFQLVHRRSRRIQFVTNPFVSCLLITNVIWPVIIVPLNLVQTWTPIWLFGRITCKIFPIVQMCFPDAISLILCLIALERYISIIYPFKQNPLLRKPIAYSAIAFVWLFPLSLNVILAFTHDLYEFYDGVYYCAAIQEQPLDSDNNINFVLSSEFVEPFKVIQSTIVMLVIPGILFPFFYGRIILKVFAMKPVGKTTEGQANKKGTNKRLSTTEKLRQERTDRRRRSVTLLSIAIQVAHFTCWTPIVVFQLIHFFHYYPQLSYAELIILRFFVLLASANPAINSLLYATALYRNKGVSKKTRQTQVRTETATAVRILVEQISMKTLDDDEEGEEEDSVVQDGLRETLLSSVNPVASSSASQIRNDSDNTDADDKADEDK